MHKTKVDENLLSLSLQMAITRKNTEITRLCVIHTRKNTKITRFPRFLGKFRTCANGWNQALSLRPSPTRVSKRAWRWGYHEPIIASTVKPNVIHGLMMIFIDGQLNLTTIYNFWKILAVAVSESKLRFVSGKPDFPSHVLIQKLRQTELEPASYKNTMYCE